MNEVTLFRRFASKAGVLRELGRRITDGTAGTASRQPPKSPNVRATLAALAQTEIASARENGGLVLRLAVEARSVQEVAEVLGNTVPANLAALGEYLADQQAAGRLRGDVDPVLIAEAFFALTSSYVMYRMVSRSGEIPSVAEEKQHVEELLDLFWSGAAPKEETR